MLAPTQATPTERLAVIIAWLASCVAAQGRRRRLAGPLVVAIWTRLHRIAARFRAVAATPVPPPRAQRPEPPVPTAPPDPAPPSPGARGPRRPPVTPRGARWLVRLVPDTAAGLSQLEALLRDPQMAALLAADPRLGRILRTLCWMLGVHRSLVPPSHRRRRPKPAARPPADPDPDPDPPGATAIAAGASRRALRPRFDLRGKELLTRLRMGPSPFWSQDD